MNWIKRNLFWIILGTIISIFPIWIIAEVVHYNLEPRHKIYVEWVVYGPNGPRYYKGTHEIVGDNFKVRKHWIRGHKSRDGYNEVTIEDGNRWGSYIANQRICIYQGLNDVDVTKFKIIE